MIDVGEKPATRRRAVAQGRIRLTEASYLALEGRTNPKGDVLALAEIAGIQAAKRTSDLLPLCHPLPLESVSVGFECDRATLSVVVTCAASTVAKTGVEMEALSGVNGALLCIYDLCKAVDPVITIEGIRLNLKEGGKSGVWQHPELQSKTTQEKQASVQSSDLSGIRAGVITVSDRCSRGEAEDRSGPALLSELKSAGAELLRDSPVCVPDEILEIRRAVELLVREHRASLVILTGGTGLGPRDVTPEALAPLWSRRIPGVGESLRSSGALKTPKAWWSRSEGGLVGDALVIALPGSLKAVREGWEALAPTLAHAIEVAQGRDGGRH